MMSKLTAQDDNQTKHFKPKVYQSKWREQTRNFYDCNYGQRNYQNRYISNSGDRRISFSGRYNMDRIIGINQGIMGIIEVILEEELLEEICDEIRIIEVNIHKKL